MRPHKSARSIVESAYKIALESSVNEEDDHEFRDFIESVSVSAEELAALVGMPELSSIHEVRQYLQQGKRSSHPIDQSSSEATGHVGFGRITASDQVSGNPPEVSSGHSSRRTS